MLARDLPAVFRLIPHLLAAKVPHSPVVATFDVTNRCTLDCPHCYWRAQGEKTELDEEAFLNKVIEIKKRHPSLLSALWMGGEPLLRQELVARCKSHFSWNEVITNGTLPLPDWQDVRFACSVDGTRQFHERQRGEGTYDRIKENIDRADLNVNIACVLTKANEPCLEEFVEEWSQTHIRSMGFGFYTPNIGSLDKSLWLGFEERDRVLDRLLALKKRYPGFINNSDIVLNSFRSERCQGTTERCRRDLAPFTGMCFDSAMRRKFPCVIGEDADCDRCGCAVVGFGEAVASRDFSWAVEHLKTNFGALRARR